MLIENIDINFCSQIYNLDWYIESVDFLGLYLIDLFISALFYKVNRLINSDLDM